MSDKSMKEKFKSMEYTCCICGKKFIGYGNNPYPVSDNEKDRCCNSCNNEVVVPIRLIQLANANGGR